MSKTLFYSIAGEVFDLYPDYVRGVVLAYDVVNGNSPQDLVAMLRAAEAFVRERLTLEDVAAHPRIASWREAYRAFGAQPSKFRSSIEAMVRRALRHQELPSINALVDIGNALSLRYLVPTGGHAIDDVTQDIALRPATGQEEFVAFGSVEVEHPLPGEIIFAEGNTVLTRRWTWRQANHTLTLPTTKSIEFNIDGLPPVPESQVRDICREVAALIEKFCGGHTHWELLARENPQMQFSC
jgi:DNA/RNA-binding domain of Phe-tRNA-synthetase-like protein